MTRMFILSAAVLLLVGGSAMAQPQPPGGGASRPTFSPYMNLLRGGSPALNYFGLVRPQQQLQQQFGQLQQQLNTNAQQLQSLNNNLIYGIDTNMPMTGHVATFNNTGHYFNSNPAYGGGGGYGPRVGGMMGGNMAGGMGQMRRTPGAAGVSGAGGSGMNRPNYGGSGGIRR